MLLHAVLQTAADVGWTYFSPAALIERGERIGKYRTGGDQPLTDRTGGRRIFC